MSVFFFYFTAVEINTNDTAPLVRGYAPLVRGYAPPVARYCPSRWGNITQST